MNNLFTSIFEIESRIKDVIDYRIEYEIYNAHRSMEEFSAIRRIFADAYDAGTYNMIENKQRSKRIKI